MHFFLFCNISRSNKYSKNRLNCSSAGESTQAKGTFLPVPDKYGDQPLQGWILVRGRIRKETVWPKFMQHEQLHAIFNSVYMFLFLMIYERIVMQVFANINFTLGEACTSLGTLYNSRREIYLGEGASVSNWGRIKNKRQKKILVNNVLVWSRMILWENDQKGKFKHNSKWRNCKLKCRVIQKLLSRRSSFVRV